MTVRGWFLPRALRSIVAEERVHTLGGVPVSMPVLAPDQLATIGAHLAGARDRVLAERSVDSIVAVLDALAEAWLDDDTPERQRALEVLPRITGTSAAMIRESIDLEQASSRADHMERALRSEFGNPAVLDGFVDNPLLGGAGQTMAVGPTLTGAVFSSNIPALPHLTAMRSLLVKSAFWGRTSRREPTFLPLYLSTLERLDPDLAACTASLWWPREARELEEPFLAASDCFVGWGGPEAEAHFRAVVPPETRFVFHGQRPASSFTATASVSRSWTQTRRPMTSRAVSLGMHPSSTSKPACRPTSCSSAETSPRQQRSAHAWRTTWRRVPPSFRGGP